MNLSIDQIASLRPPAPLDRARGCLMGLAIGDALGAPVEGLDSRTIMETFGGGRGYLTKLPVDVLHYTDDTQMTIGVAESLLDKGVVDEADMMSRFAANYDPHRGYGQGARLVLEAARDGQDWRAVRDGLFENGSFGNGGAMRVAPVAVRFAHQPDRLWEQAAASARVTHTHELGIEGACLIATATAYALTQETIDPPELLNRLHDLAKTEEFQWQLKTALQRPLEDAFYLFGNGLEAHRSVMTAILCFLLHQHSYVDTIAAAIGRGGDTDTIAAMAGGLSGAFLGVKAIPQGFQERFEQQTKGLSYVEGLATSLWHDQPTTDPVDRGEAESWVS